jgi:hypothetical protein
MDNETLMRTWCRMWNEDPALAHQVMTGHCTQWSAQTPGLDAVIGPDQQETFVAGYRAQHINLFHPRVLVDAGDRFAYLWDVTLPNGTVWTGADVNTVRDGRIDENWTFVCQRRDDSPDLDDADAQPTTVTALDRLCQEWTSLWNGDVHAVADDVRVFIGAGDQAAELRGRAALTGHLEAERAVQSSTTRVIHRQPVLDPVRGRAAILWTSSTDGGGRSSGVDLLTVHHGRVACASSLTGTRQFRY